MVRHTAQLSSSGGIPELEIRFGHANVGVYRLFRWDAHGQPEAVSGLALEEATISYEAIVQSPRSETDQGYSMFITIRQDGETVPGGAISEAGKLNRDGVKSIIGFIRLQLS